MGKRTIRAAVVVLMAAVLATAAVGTAEDDLYDRVEHHFASSEGVKIHYVTVGDGPVILFVHGFPDFWYTWRYQMEGLSDRFRCAAMDTRAYNRSDKPEGVENFSLDLLQSDVAAVIDDLGVEDVILVGHDWGGFICWTFAMRYPERVNKLIIMNLFHPHPPVGETSEEERVGGAYRDEFRKPGFHERFTAEGLARVGAGQDEKVRQRYVTAMSNSDFEGMLNYYQLTTRPFSQENLDLLASKPNISMPVLQFHGLDDMAVHKDRLRDSWDWIDNDYTLVTLPRVGHWVQRDAAELVTTTMRWWLLSRLVPASEAR
jgi:pimeloyl-ACP methyl ester carboxylesterase